MYGGGGLCVIITIKKRSWNLEELMTRTQETPEEENMEGFGGREGFVGRVNILK